MQDSSRIRSLLKSVCPRPVRAAVRSVQGWLDPRGGRMRAFDSIYQSNGWNGGESVSGQGSDLSQTAVIRREIPVLLKEIHAGSLLDAPCGDFFWMKETELGIGEYIGVDIVPELIASNNEQYGGSGRRFIVADIANDDLPAVDVILCRDCLVHLSFQHATAAIANLKRSGSTYLLSTTFPAVASNADIKTGEWRPLNLQFAPFRFPEPVKLINEECTEVGGKYADKSLGLWRLDTIPD